jgi:hypothetical protein
MDDREATRLRRVLAVRFRAGTDRGEIIGKMPAEILSDLYLGHVLAALLAWYGNQSLSLRPTLDAVTDLFWNGAREP